MQATEGTLLTIDRATGQAPATARELPRLASLDNLRVLLAVLVVAHHAGQPYGPTGGDWPLFSPERAPILGAFFSVNAAFFMGLFFLISGYLTPAAYDRKGARSFLGERLLRLGIPLLVFSLAVFGPIAYASGASGLPFWQYMLQVYLGQGQIETGHLWFLSHLLVYGLAYTGWRLVTGGLGGAVAVNPPIPSHRAILLYGLALAAVTFVVRLWYPIDHWVRLLGLIRVEVAHVPQYLSLFLLGIVAYRGDWLRRLPTATGLSWLGIGLAAGLARYLDGIVRGALGWSVPRADGGLNWGALVWSTWEAFICVGLCVGLLVLFRERLSRQNRLLRMLSANAYGVYVIHVLPIVGLQFSLAGTSLPPLAKFAIVTLVGVPLCFAISRLIRHLPPVRRVL